MNFVKSCINKTIGRVNKSIKYEKLENNNKTNTFVYNYKHTLSVYDIKGEEKTSSTSEK